jgi:hypothetical protein
MNYLLTDRHDAPDGKTRGEHLCLELKDLLTIVVARSFVGGRQTVGVVRPGPGYTPRVQRAEGEVGLTMSDVTPPGRLRDLLEQSMSEKTAVVVYFRSGQLRGTVAKLDDELVELSTTGGRCAIRLDRVDAVARE